MPRTTIRPAHRGDLPQIFELLRSKAECSGGFEFVMATAEQIDEALFGKQPRASALVAEGEQGLVGIATYFETYSTFLAQTCLWLDDLFVAVGERSRGVGKLLLEELARLAVKQGISRIDWTMAATNDRGQAFYQRMGATIRTGTLTARLDQPAIERLAKGLPDD